MAGDPLRTAVRVRFWVTVRLPLTVSSRPIQGAGCPIFLKVLRVVRFLPFVTEHAITGEV